MAPTISILTPVYNGARYLGATLDSVRSQSFQDWELILQDGASSDGTLLLAEDYAKRDPRIRIYSEPDEGPYDALHRALSRACGDLVCVLCVSDGYLRADWLSDCADAFRRDPELSLVWGITFEMDADGQVLGPLLPYAPFLRDGTGRRRFWGSLVRRLAAPGSWTSLLRRLNGANLRVLGALHSSGEPPQKRTWFEYWLRSGSYFHDASMCVSRRVFAECLAPYHVGSREPGDWSEFYYNFNSCGYLSHCIPLKAAYLRSGAEAQAVSEKWREYNISNRTRYLERVGRLRDLLRQDPSRVMFRDRGGRDLGPDTRP